MSKHDTKRATPTPAADADGASTATAPAPSRTPPRAMPWWLLVTFVAVAVASAWLGATFGGSVVRAVRGPAGPSATISGDGVSMGHDGHGSGGSEGDGAEAEFYTCGMHPWVILPHEGDCPICHMKLTPLDPAKFTGEVAIDPVVVQNIGVRVEPVVEGPLVRTLRTVGSVDYDETRVRDVNTKFSGWIERLYVDYVGAPVEQGEPLFDVYSPALFQAQEEFLLALRTRRGQGTPVEGGDRDRIDLVESARTKLRLFDITDEQIGELAEAGEPSRTMSVLSPHTGVVIAKHANEGMSVDPGMQVFRVADLSRVWVLVTLYESQLPYVSEGQRAVMTLPYIPGQTFEGQVAYKYPYVDTRTHEVEVRLEFDNPTGLLKPGMFATVELQSTLKRNAVLAPRSAVISTGTRDMAFVSLGEGRFEPRRVRLGVEAGDGRVEILDGLRPGEMVVTSGQFLLDSESRVREALAKMIRGDLASEQRAEVAVAGASELKSLPDPVAAGLGEALDAYFVIADRLASDTVEGIAEPARTLGAALDRTIGVPIPGDEHFWHEHTEAAVARGKALELVSAQALPVAREAFAELSHAMDSLMRATGIPPEVEEEVQTLHCPMFREGQGGGTWLQPAGPVRNPFFGSTMLECFDRRETLPVTGGESAPAEQSPSPPEAEQGLSDAGPEARQAVDRVLEAYLDAQERLTEDDAAGARAALGHVHGSLAPVVALSGEPGEAARRLVSALGEVPMDLEGLRSVFASASNELLLISEAVAPSSAEGGLFHAYCPMVKEHWLQIGEDIKNPYDPNMLSCGVIRGRVDEGAER